MVKSKEKIFLDKIEYRWGRKPTEEEIKEVLDKLISESKQRDVNRLTAIQTILLNGF